jgi:hypothetical protein
LPKKEDFTLILMLKNNMSKNLGDCMFMGWTDFPLF